LAGTVAAPIPPLAILNGVVNVNEVAEAAPKLGVTKVGLVANTISPVPVLPLMVATKFAVVGVVKKS
jgi:hypothetical protein